VLLEHKLVCRQARKSRALSQTSFQLLSSACSFASRWSFGFGTASELRGHVILKQADGTLVKPTGAFIQVYRTDAPEVYQGKTSKGGKFVFKGMPNDGAYAIAVSLPGAFPTLLTNVRLAADLITS